MLCEKLAEFFSIIGKEKTISLSSDASTKNCRAAFAAVQGHQACGCHRVFTSLMAKRPAGADRFAVFLLVFSFSDISVEKEHRHKHEYGYEPNMESIM